MKQNKYYMMKKNLHQSTKLIKNSIKLFIIKLLDKESDFILKSFLFSIYFKKEEKYFFEKPKFINLDKFLRKKN